MIATRIAWEERTVVGLTARAIVGDPALGEVWSGRSGVVPHPASAVHKHKTRDVRKAVRDRPPDGWMMEWMVQATGTDGLGMACG